MSRKEGGGLDAGGEEVDARRGAKREGAGARLFGGGEGRGKKVLVLVLV